MNKESKKNNSQFLIPNSPKLKVALVHDWLIGGGAELVVLELHKMFPNAPIYTSYSTDEWRTKLNNKVITGYLQNWPFSKLRKFIPFLRGWWFSRLDLSEYDLVISSSGAEAKFIKLNPKKWQMVNGKINDKRKMVNGKWPLHVAYIHAPTHYYWSRYNEYMRHPGFGFFDPLARLGLKVLVGPMRRWDYRAAQRPDVLVANSSYTKTEIKKYYKRGAAVIHPPVDVEYFKPKSGMVRNGFVIAGRQTPYKRFDLAIVACNKLNLILNVVGDGPEYKKLKSISGPTINFLGHISRSDLRDHLQKAEGFIFPGKDDFGIAAVEALAAGTPVIAYGQGGALDYINNKTGLTFEKQTVDSLAAQLKKFQSNKFSPSTVSKEAMSFSSDIFQKKIFRLINS